MLIDQESVFYNPAAMALYHLNKRMSVTSPNGTSVPPVSDDFKLSGSSLTYSVLQDEHNENELSVGVFFQRLSGGKNVVTSTFGVRQTVVEPSSTAYGLSLAYSRNGLLNYAFGVTGRYLNTETFFPGNGSLESPATIETANIILADVSAIAEFPLLGTRTGENATLIRVSVLQTIIGSRFVFTDLAQAEPAPWINQSGIAVLTEWGDPSLRSISYLVSAELYSDVSGPSQQFNSSVLTGMEAGFFETFYLRFGATFDGDRYESTIFSYGAGFSSIGLLKLIESAQTRASKKRSLWQSIDLRFDIAKIPNQNYGKLSQTNSWKVSLSWYK